MDRTKVEKFFQNKCTPAESEEVLEWFQTPEGQAFLKKKLDQDIIHLQDEDIKPITSEIRSEVMWDVIETGLEPTAKKNSNRSPRKGTSYWQAAAAIVLLLITTVFYVWSQRPLVEEGATKPKSPVSYTTGSDQQRTLTLSDGTTIRMNSNAKLQISRNYARAAREVTLEGEAFFEVIHNAEKPFIIHTSQTTIQDLGTAFNIRALPEEDNVQVAVTEGKVSIKSERQSEEQAIELSQGQFGYLNLEEDSMHIDQFGVDNYLSWMNGRLRFDQATLNQVSTQLSRLYGASFTYSTTSLKDRALTADFERGSLKKALDVISLTLGIAYSMEEEQVIWKTKTTSSN